MKCAAVPASALADSWVAGFQILKADHAPLVAELVDKFSTADLKVLALALPFDQAAANAVWPQMRNTTRSDLRDLLDEARRTEKRAEAARKKAAARGLDPDEVPPEPEPPPASARQDRRLRAQIGTYVAAAAQFARAKFLEEILEVARQKLAVAERFESVMKTAKARQAGALRAALLRDPADLEGNSGESPKKG